MDKYCIDCGKELTGHGKPVRCRSCSKKGHTVSQQTRDKISKANKGNPFWNRGKESYWLFGNKWNKGRPSSRKGKHTGIRPWNYVDGRSKWLSPARYGDDWEAIRYLVYMRDKFTCQGCGITLDKVKRNFDVHHIKPFLDGGSNSLDNLTTLCRSCHSKIEATIKKKVLLCV